MSFFDDASLVFLPSGEAGKDGKAYSMKPTDGSGDFTFSRGSNLTATRVDSNGLIEKGRENLLLQSNQFDTTWTNNNSTETSGQSGYDGSSDAWLLTSLSSYASIQQNINVSGVFTISLYLKSGSNGGVLLQVIGISNSLVRFNLDNGTLISKESAVISANIESIGNGWHRASYTLNGSITTFRIYPADNTGDHSVVGSIYIQDAQLEQGLVATEYIESGATTGKAGILEDSPRFDYSGGASCPSLLLEPSRTNLIGYSEYLSSIFSGIRMDINDLVDTSPEGFINASKLIPDTTPNSTHQSNTGNYGSFVSGDKITISIFAKADGFDGIILRFLDGSGAFTTNRIAKFDLSRGRWENSSMDGTIGVMEGEVGMEALGNGWYRCFATATADATGDVDIRIPVADVTTQDTYNEVFTGDGTKGVLIYGLQLEQGSYPTSYIPNHSGGSVTRAAETNTTANISSVIGQQEGTFFLDFEYLNGQAGENENWIALESENGQERVMIYKSAANNYFRAFLTANNSLVFNNPFSSIVITPNTRYKIAFRYSSRDIAIAINGNIEFTDSSTYTRGSNLSRLLFNETNVQPSCRVHQSIVFDSGLTNSELENLTS